MLVDRLSDRKQKIVQSLLIKVVFRKQGSQKESLDIVRINRGQRNIMK